MSDLLCGFSVGDAVVATKDIWDDGQDHYPPGYIAKAGERLYVREVGNRIGVSHHNVNDKYFLVDADEIRQA